MYFSALGGAAVSGRNAWQHVYRLLLWADQTTGLAHCYESDKCQPGKRWYARSLAFHDWLASALQSSPGKLSTQIDWLFQKAATELAAEAMRNSSAASTAAIKQRAPYESRGFPEPGVNPELIAIVREVLGKELAREPSVEKWAALTQRIRQFVSLENKRKNLLGEGFEDVLAWVIRESCKSKPIPKVTARALLTDLPGFTNYRAGSKANKVDVAVIQGKLRILVTAKWSVRADREKQFHADFSDYVAAESSGKPFQYVLATNEFDPARLVRACETLSGNTPLFSRVVHISTDALKATYGDFTNEIPRPQDATMRRVLDHIETGRLISLERWVSTLTQLRLGA